MKRDPEFRKKVLELDDYRCQITGYDGRDVGARGELQADHVVELGAGGSKVKDVPENGITLHWRIHDLKTKKKFFIEKWDRENGILELGDETHHIITKDPKALRKLFGIDKLYFYRKDEVERGEQITTRLRGYSLIDNKVGKDVYDLEQVYKAVDTEAKSLKDYLMNRGIDPALTAAGKLYKKSLALNFPWGDGWSKVDYQKQLKDAGFVKPKRFRWLVWRLGEQFQPRWFRGTTDQIVDKIDPNKGEVAVRVGKMLGLIWNEMAEELFDREGNEMPFEEL